MDFMNDKTETTLGVSLSSAQCLWTGNKVSVLPQMACEACTLKIPAKICDDSAEIAAGVVSPVEIIMCVKMEDK